MPKKAVEKSQYLQILDNKGNADKKLEPKLDSGLLKEMYEKMILAREFDRVALALQREGRMFTYAPVFGQEASQVGSALALKSTDWMFPSFREWGAYIARGVPLKTLYLYSMGHHEGGRIPRGNNDFTVSIPVASQLLHAVGAAYAAAYKKQKIATIAYFGDGATSEGDFHEAMNFAGVFKTPTVFFCQNNGWAISVPREWQTASKTLAQKAFAYGFDGIQIDGNDVLAVYTAALAALENARQGKGPTMIEAVTYRCGPHTTADNPEVYRKEVETKKICELNDPIGRFVKYLQAKKLFSESYETSVLFAAKEQVQEAVSAAEAEPAVSVKDLFSLFEKMPDNLKEQLEKAQLLEKVKVVL